MDAGKVIKSIISLSHKPVSRIAREAGIPQQVLQRFVAGDRDNLRLDTIDKLFKYFDIKLIANTELLVMKEKARGKRHELINLVRDLESISRAESSVRECIAKMYVAPVNLAKLDPLMDRLKDAVNRVVREAREFEKQVT